VTRGGGLAAREPPELGLVGISSQHSGGNAHEMLFGAAATTDLIRYQTHEEVSSHPDDKPISEGSSQKNLKLPTTRRA